MIWHHHEFVQSKFPLTSIVVEDVDEQRRGAIGLKKISLPADRRSDKESSRVGDNVRGMRMTPWDRHNSSG
jgi:hypothetical protein